MRDSRRLILPVLAAAAAIVAQLAAVDESRTAADTPAISSADRAATFRFAPDTAPADRAAVLAAVADARPHARRLIGMVDGLTDVVVGPTGTPAVLGLTESRGGRYSVT